MMKRHILLSLVLAAGASLTLNAKQDDTVNDVSSKPAQLQDRALREGAAQRLVGLMQNSQWLSPRHKERLFDMIASDATREDIQQQIAALQEQLEELGTMLATKMGELEALEAGTTAHTMKQGEVNMVAEHITLVEKKIAGLSSDKGFLSRETLWSLVAPVLYLAYRRTFAGKQFHTTFARANDGAGNTLEKLPPVVKAFVMFVVIEWFLLGRNSLIGKATGRGVSAMDAVSQFGQYVFGKGQMLDKLEQWIENSLSGVTNTISETFADAKADTVLMVGAVAVVLGFLVVKKPWKKDTPAT